MGATNSSRSDTNHVCIVKLPAGYVMCNVFCLLARHSLVHIFVVLHVHMHLYIMSCSLQQQAIVRNVDLAVTEEQAN